ncbi:hypothetical protein [Nocardia cyriacigeorgica]|uniref:hypothetical protein n=1 Tax=Nocardia cyriacigeorgica TaxID=135487 RepID=UPI00245583F1|nr:hypothetical protein [Nocardia cyriacigeorgica]
MGDNEPVDYDAVRQRFPWVGLADTGEGDLSARYREMMANARRDREIVEAIEAVQRRR